MSTTATERITGARLNLYLPLSLFDSLCEMAREADRPISREIRRALVAHVARHEQEAAVGD